MLLKIYVTTYIMVVRNFEPSYINQVRLSFIQNNFVLFKSEGHVMHDRMHVTWLLWIELRGDNLREPHFLFAVPTLII